MNKSTAGFTLVELMVTIAIVAVMSAISISYYKDFKDKAVSAQIISELVTIRTAAKTLEMDTGQILGGSLSGNGCHEIGTHEVRINSCAAGLLCNDGRFVDWAGPYLNKPIIDPYGNAYFYDGDYECQSGINGCGAVANNTVVNALHSTGPDGTHNNYDAEETALVLCVL